MCRVYKWIDIIAAARKTTDFTRIRENIFDQKIILCSKTYRGTREINNLLLAFLTLLSNVRVHCWCLPLGVLPLVGGEDGQDDAAHVPGLGILELAAVKCSPTKGDNPGINPVLHLLQHEFRSGIDR